VISRVRPWRAAGPDGIHGYYWKKVPQAKLWVKGWIRDVLEKRAVLRKDTCKGRVVLIPKGEVTSDPSAMRPITCLNISLKCLNATIASVLEGYLVRALPTQQNAVRRGTWGVTEARTIDGMLTQVSRRGKELYSSSIDFSKAFDSISHEYIRRMMGYIRVPEIVRKTNSDFLEFCTVQYEVRSGRTASRSRTLDVKRGVPQGDTLSPMIFCLAVAPISFCLDSGMRGYQVRTTTNGSYISKRYSHLFFADDLELYAETEEELSTGIAIVQQCASAVNLSLNPTKCATTHRLGSGADRVPILPVLRDSGYKYLGNPESGYSSDRGTLY